MCMWVKENMCASCEAVRGDGAVRIRKEACVRCVRKSFKTGGLQYWWKEEVVWEWSGSIKGGKGMLVGVITANAVVKDDMSAA